MKFLEIGGTPETKSVNPKYSQNEINSVFYAELGCCCYCCFDSTVSTKSPFTLQN